VTLAIDRRKGEIQLFVKEVRHAGTRYIVCRNKAEAANDRAVREAIVATLDTPRRRRLCNRALRNAQPLSP
jgi:ABC-type oligopeptide transport system substrate-binding subunit